MLMPHRAPSRSNVTVKRRIEKVVSSTNVLSTTGVASHGLHTAEDAKTLVRTILTISIMPLSSIDVDIDNVTQFVVAIRPTDVAVIVPTVSSRLDADVSNLELFRGQIQAFQNATVGTGGGMTLTIDSKGMRKLKVGDKVVLDHISLEINNCRISWTALLIFKE